MPSSETLTTARAGWTQLLAAGLVLAGATVLGVLDANAYGEMCRSVYLAGAGYALGAVGKSR